MIGKDELIARQNRISFAKLKWQKLVEKKLVDMRAHIQANPNANIVDEFTEIPDPAIHALSNKYGVPFQEPDKTNPYPWMFISEHNGHIKLVLKGVTRKV